MPSFFPFSRECSVRKPVSAPSGQFTALCRLSSEFGGGVSEGGRPVIPQSVLSVARRHVAELPPAERFMWQLSGCCRVPVGW